MSEKNKFIEHYKANADDYDITRDFRNKITKYFHDKQVAYILETLKNINSVVEIGPGTGKFTIPLAKAGKYVIAIDSSEEMLDLIYKKAVEHNVSKNITLKLGDIENIDIPDSYAEAVLSIALVRHLPDPRTSLSEITRILKPNAVLVIDYLSKYYFSLPNMISKIVFSGSYVKGKKWFKNYYYTKSSFLGLLNQYSLYPTECKRFVSIPTFILNLLPYSVVRLIYSIEDRFNIGSMVYVKSIKK